MAQKVRLDALEEQKLDQSGDPIAIKSQRDVAARLVHEAREAIPAGVADASPYKRLSKDELIAEAARLDMRFGAWLSEDDLRLVVEHYRLKLSGAPAVSQIAPQPPVPMQPSPPVKIRGLKESPSNTWIVRRTNFVHSMNGQMEPPLVSVGNGQMARLRSGARIELRHYTVQILEGMVNQGVDLIPIEDSELHS